MRGSNVGKRRRKEELEEVNKECGQCERMWEGE